MAYWVAVFVLVALASHLLTVVAVRVFERLGLLEPPSERGLLDHTSAKGGGWVVVLLVAALWPLLAQFQEIHGSILVSALILACISWLDDLRSMPPMQRLLVQVLLVALCLTLLPRDQFILSRDLGLVPDRVIAGLCWVWFTNLFNFMDGIDGLASIEAVAICLGVLVVGTLAHLAAQEMVLAILVAAACLGFLPRNWYPSKILLGDVGAVPLGFLLGWLLIALAIKGEIVAAFILSSYFVLDATLTLLRRLSHGERFWLPHRRHLYQLAVAGTATQFQVNLGLLVVDLFLVLAAYVSLEHKLLGCVLAAVVVVPFVAWLYRCSR